MRTNIAPPVGADARIDPATPPRRKHPRGVEDAAPYEWRKTVANPARLEAGQTAMRRGGILPARRALRHREPPRAGSIRPLRMGGKRGCKPIRPVTGQITMRRGGIHPARGPCLAANRRGRAMLAPTIVGKTRRATKACSPANRADMESAPAKRPQPFKKAAACHFIKIVPKAHHI